eukprot:271725_1
MSASSTSPPSKKRRLNQIEDLSKSESKTNSIFELILNCSIDDVFANNKTSDELEQFLNKIKLMEKETEKRLIKSMPFVQNDVSNTASACFKLKKFIKCIEAHVDDDDVEANNYLHCTSNASFEVGPNQEGLDFNCSIGSDEGVLEGKATLNSLVTLDFSGDGYHEIKLDINLQSIKAFVERCGFEGVGNDNGYGYYAFAGDLLDVCLDMLRDKAGCCWYGSIEFDDDVDDINGRIRAMKNK